MGGADTPRARQAGSAPLAAPLVRHKTRLSPGAGARLARRSNGLVLPSAAKASQGRLHQGASLNRRARARYRTRTARVEENRARTHRAAQGTPGRRCPYSARNTATTAAIRLLVAGED